MIHKLFSIFDQKAEAYLPPFQLPKVEVAKRVFSDCVNSDSHQFAKNPGDYHLFEIGDFDDETGIVSPHQAHRYLGHGLDYKRPAEYPVVSQEKYPPVNGARQQEEVTSE